MNTAEMILLPALGCMVVGWFVLLLWTFRRLRIRHAVFYESRLGSPSLFWDGRLRTAGWPFVRFVFSSQWRQLDDPAIGVAVRFMRIYLLAYVVLFAVLIIVSLAPHRAP